MSINFREMLSVPTDSVERPKPLPDGHYIGAIKGHEFGQSKNKGTPFVRFILTTELACDDVDQAALVGMDLSKKEVQKDYFITPSALYRLSDMLDAVLGKQAGRSFDERIPDTSSVRVMFGAVARNDDDGNPTGFNNITTITRHDG